MVLGIVGSDSRRGQGIGDGDTFKAATTKEGKGGKSAVKHGVCFAISLCILYKYVTSTCMQNKKLEYTHVETKGGRKFF